MLRKTEYKHRECNKFLILLNTLILTSFLVAPNCISEENVDIYDQIANLVDSLRVWQVNPPSEISPPDSRYLMDFFPGAIVKTDRNSSGVIIQLPNYMGILTTSLYVSDIDFDNKDSKPYWQAPIRVENDHLILDENPVLCDTSILCKSDILDFIAKKVTFLRTIGLPEHLQANNRYDNEVYVTVHVRGRDIEELEFTSETWFRALNRIAFGMQIYAGILQISGNTESINVKYYILVTYPEAKGHHFLDWIEKYQLVNNEWRTQLITIDFTPYIRTDNLKDLFAQPVKPDRTPIKLHINR